MADLKFTTRAAAEYAALRDRAAASLKKRKGKRATKASGDEGLFKQVHKTLQLLSDNPRHPGLRTQKYRSLHPPPEVSQVFEAYAQSRTPGAYRIFWGYGPAEGEITIIAITPHP